MSHNNPAEPGLCTQTGRRQVLYTTMAVSAELSIGMALGFAAVMQPQITAEGLLTSVSETAWLVSTVFLLLPVGNLVNGVLMDTLGRGRALTVGVVPLFVGWLYTGLSKNVVNIIIGRAITGFGCGMATAPSRVYIAEIALPHMRGTLAAFSPLSTSLGITIQGAVGSFLPWHLTCFLCAAYTAGVFAITFLLPETPYYLMRKDRTHEEIARSLKRLRGDDYNIEEELDAMEDFNHTHPILRLSCFAELKDMFTRIVCHPFLIIITYNLITQMSGLIIMVQWTVDIVNESEITVNANLCNVLMSATRFITLIFVAVMIYHLRRKVLALVSSIGVAVSCFVIFVHLKFSHEPHPYPLLFYITYYFFSTVGYFILPSLLMTEIYPLKVRGHLSGITLAYVNLLSFIFTKLYSNVHAAIGLANVFLGFALSSVAGTIFLIIFLPETKGLTLHEIEVIFGGRPTLAASLHDLAARSQMAVSRTRMQLH